MRTTVEIDEELLEKARACGKFETKTAAVEAALQLLLEKQIWKEFHEARGPDLFWPDYDYKAMRRAD
jgi:Arc/MetJ family transcription regulator